MDKSGDPKSLEVLVLEERLENARQELEMVANMLRGMTLDPAIPEHAKAAMRHKYEYIESLFDDGADVEDEGED